MPRHKEHSPLKSATSAPSSKGYPYRKSRNGTGISVTVSQEVHTARERGQPVHIPMVDIDGEADLESEDAVVSVLVL